MSEFLEITGGVPLKGSVRVGGAKNGALPMLIASLLSPDEITFSNVPNLEDINLTLHLLESFGAEVLYTPSRYLSTGEQTVGVAKIKVPRLLATEASYSLVKSLRASFWVLGPLLARGGAARVALPGGDIIGARPVDIHLAALTEMGAEIKVKHGVVYAAAPNGLTPATINFRFPSVGATHQLIMAASLTKGVTTLKGCAREPEIVALAEMINILGGNVQGAGNSEIVITGVETLHGGAVPILGDRIEGGTYLLAAAATKGSVTVAGLRPEFFGDFLRILSECGFKIETGADFVKLSHTGTFNAVKVATGPFPEFATDLQAPLMAALTQAAGESSIEEHIFEGRFGHASELSRLGAQISLQERAAIISGPAKLSGAPVEGQDIRAAAALVVAALAAEGKTHIFESHHIRRGYENLEQKLQSLGAKISKKQADQEDFSFAGC